MDKGSREIQKIELVGLSLVEKLNPNSFYFRGSYSLLPYLFSVSNVVYMHAFICTILFGPG